MRLYNFSKGATVAAAFFLLLFIVLGLENVGYQLGLFVGCLMHWGYGWYVQKYGDKQQ